MTTSRDLLKTRLRTQRLTGTPFRTAADAVRFLGAVQAQDLHGAKWSLGMRVQGATDLSLDAALGAGKILRTHVLRPTWHFVAPEDLRWMLALSAPQVNRVMSYQHRNLELDRKLFARIYALLERGLGGGNHLTRAEVSALLGRGKIVATGQRLGHILVETELNGVICSGRPRGKEQTYALLEEWVRPGPVYPRAEAIARLAQRFFTSHGPATWKQFAWWASLTVKEAQQAREALRGIDVEQVNGVEWLSPPQRTTTSKKPGALLIPEFDEVLTGWAEIGIPRTIADRRRGKPTSSFDRPILFDGAWIGNWRRTISIKEVVLEVWRIAKWTSAQERSVVTEGARFAKFLGRPVRMV